MLRKLQLLVIPLLVASCDLFRSPLDQPFDPATYPVWQVKLLKSESITEEELFLLNYCIVRQREYFNYEIAGKSYGEILGMAKQMQAEGLPVETKLAMGKRSPELRASAENDGVGFIRDAGNSKYLLKVLLFSCVFENTTDRDLALLNASFHFRGPFRDHLLSTGYQVNCLIPAGDKSRVEFYASGQDIQRNALFDGDPKLDNLFIDTLLNRITVEVAGYDIARRPAHFDLCRPDGSRREAEWIFDYDKSLKQVNWREQDPDGHTLRLMLDGAKYVDPGAEEY